jgi:hypothetical protein
MLERERAAASPRAAVVEEQPVVARAADRLSQIDVPLIPRVAVQEDDDDDNFGWIGLEVIRWSHAGATRD